MKTNTTGTEYFSAVEKGFLPVVFVPCALVFLLLYKFSKQPLRNEQSMASRMQYFYSMASAALLGEILFHVLPFLSQPFPATFGLGFVIILCVETLLPRLRSRNSLASSQPSVELMYSVDHEEVNIHERLVVDDCLDEDYAEQANTMAQEKFELRKRRTIVVVFLLTFIPFVLLDGFYFSAFMSFNSILQLVAFYLDRLLQTLAVAVLMIHAFFHGTKKSQWPWYLLVSIVWCLVCALTAIPAITGYNFLAQTPSYVGINMFYSLFGGILLWMAFYLNSLVQQQQQKFDDNKSTTLRLLSFVIIFFVSGIITVFI